MPIPDPPLRTDLNTVSAGHIADSNIIHKTLKDIVALVNQLEASLALVLEQIGAENPDTPVDPPPPPPNNVTLTATTGDGTITANWTAALTTTGYTVAISPTGTGSGATSATKSTTQFSHTFTGLTNGSQYLITLTINPSGEQRAITATPASAAQNLMASKVGISTVADSTVEPGNPVSNMTDGSLTTRWISQPTSPATVTWDLGAVYDLTRIVIVFAGNTIKNYTVSLSTNNSTYTQVNSGITNNTEQQSVTIDNFTGTAKGRYIRLTAVDRWNAAFGNSIWEVTAYGTVDASAPAGTVSALNNGTLTDTTVPLTWTYSGSTLTNFTLQRNGVTIATPAAGATSYTDTGLTAGSTYTYTLVGNFSAGGQTNTATKTATTTGGSTGTARGNLGTMIFVNQAIKTGTQTWADFDIEEAVAAGYTWVRLDIPDGSYGSTDPNTRVFTRNQGRADFYKRICAKTRAAGLKIQLDMAAFPNNTGWTDAQFTEATGNQVRAVSQDIGQYVNLWQFFNEHDGRDFRNHSPSDKSAAYFGRLRDCLAGLRTAARTYSSAPVTTTTYGYPVDQARYDLWVRFWDVVSPAADIIGIHAYPADNQTNINNLATYMTNLRNRYGKPICILEFGLPDVAGYGTSTNVGNWIVKQIQGVMSVSPFCAILYHLRDRGLNNAARDVSGELVFGVLNNNGTQKSYYGAVKTEALLWD